MSTLVEFKSVICDIEETHEREVQQEMHGITPEVFKEKDILMSTVIDMDRVISWDETTVVYNNTIKKCVFAKMDDESWTRHLLIDSDKFKQIYEYVHNTKVKNIEDFFVSL
jgi:hypothetical protein